MLGFTQTRVYISEAPHHSIMKKMRLDPGFVRSYCLTALYEDDNHLSILGGKTLKMKMLFKFLQR